MGTLLNRGLYPSKGVCLTTYICLSAGSVLLFFHAALLYAYFAIGMQGVFCFPVPCPAHDDVADVYRQCHILLKTSKLETFSYPPLEMMATGGFVVARPNGGNAEYLIDNESCLLCSPGDYEGAVDAIERISSDADLRLRLIEGSRKTVTSRVWKALESEIAALYE